MTKYHPDANPTALPAVTGPASLFRMPWGGNAWWDLPIMRHVDQFVHDPARPLAVRREVAELAGRLMTGEDCRFATDVDFLEYLEQ